MNKKATRLCNLNNLSRPLPGKPAFAGELPGWARLPNWISIRLGLSAALLSTGHADDALRILRELEALHPESEEVKAGILAAKSRGKTL